MEQLDAIWYILNYLLSAISMSGKTQYAYWLLKLNTQLSLILENFLMFKLSISKHKALVAKKGVESLVC